MERKVHHFCTNIINYVKYWYYSLFFNRVIPEEGPASQNPSGVRKLAFCSGRVYYDLLKERRERGLEKDIAIAR